MTSHPMPQVACTYDYFSTIRSLVLPDATLQPATAICHIIMSIVWQSFHSLVAVPKDGAYYIEHVLGPPAVAAVLHHQCTSSGS